MLGGPAFSALAALRCGAGRVILALPAPLLPAGLILAPSATGVALPVSDDGELLPSACAEILDGLLPEITCLAVGPGLGVGEPQRQLVLRALGQERVPVVVDADALNALAATSSLQLDLRAATVLTPHPGEFARLAASLAVAEDPLSPAQRCSAAAALSRRLGCVTVLKGHRTVVSDGMIAWECAAGGPVLATAGSGDVLTGAVAGLIAQFGRRADGARFQSLGSPREPRAAELSMFDCARLAVEFHARAADRWAAGHGDAGMLAADLLEGLPREIAEYRAVGPV